MTDEQLKKGKEITEKIQSLKNHRETILTRPGYGNFDTSKFRLQVYPNQHNADSRTLIHEYLAFPVENLIELYISKIDKAIIELEKEFKKL